MADRERLRAAMLKQLGDIDLRGESFTDVDGGRSYGFFDHVVSREMAVDALMPLIEYWMENTMLVSEADFEAITSEAESDKVKPKLRELLQQKSTFEVE